MKLTQREIQKYSLARLMSGERGLEVEISEQIARDAGREHNAMTPVVPWQVLGRAYETRDMTAAGTWGSANLIGTETADPLAILEPWSVVMRGGVTRVSGLQGDVVYPKQASATTGYWLADETSPITESTPTVSTIHLSPKRAAARVEYTRQMSKQVDIERFLSRALLSEMGRLVDVAAVAGSGSAGQPQGLIGSLGVGTQAGGSFDFADAHAMLAALGNCDDDKVLWYGPSAVRSLLGQRDIGTATGRMIWDNDSILGKPAKVSASAPSATLVVGDWQHLLVAFWGEGPQFVIDPFTQGFATGLISARVLLTVDVAVLRPEAFVYSNAIT